MEPGHVSNFCMKLCQPKDLKLLYLSNYYHFFVFYSFCFVVVFWEKSCFELFILIRWELILWFFFFEICWLVYWISPSILTINGGTNFLEKLVQLSISCFKEIRAFRICLSDKSSSYLHRGSSVTLYLFLQWLIIINVFNECSVYYSKLKSCQM